MRADDFQVSAALDTEDGKSTAFESLALTVHRYDSSFWVLFHLPVLGGAIGYEFLSGDELAKYLRGQNSEGRQIKS